MAKYVINKSDSPCPKYEEKAEKSLEKYNKQMSQFENKIFDMPKRPISGFMLYVSDRMPDIKKEKPKLTSPELIGIIAKEWQKGKDVDQKSYNKKAEKEHGLSLKQKYDLIQETT